MRRLLFLAVVWLVAFPAAAGAQQPAPDLDVRVERDASTQASFTELAVYHRITLIDKTTGQPPKAGFEVFAQAALPDGKDQTLAYECEEMYLNDPKIPPRVYRCPLFVDHGGTWNLTVIVNKQRADPKQTPVPVAKASASFQLDTKDVYTGDPNKKVIRGKFAEVFALSGHEFSAAIWFFCVLALAALVFPAFRRNLSPAALYRLERHLDLIVKLTFAATGVVIASGVYLMVNQTAYKTPFSKSAIDGVFALPFGKPYFVTLAVKLTIYALMVVASLPLIRGAQRNLRLYSEAVPAAPGLWSPKAGAAVAGGGVATAVETAAPDRPTERTATLPALIGTLVVLFGLPSILVCVTLLKYFHELVEASRVISGR